MTVRSGTAALRLKLWDVESGHLVRLPPRQRRSRAARRPVDNKALAAS